ncbi:uncharacterized protein G2W53_044915 [Senna tora]|uniref:Uncharacterized protein n=1 Tax=Senna tora TaxID=362788 RepID=A0A834SHZ1_9FABA|nr:uncharacterized protein G2W53_044915 [Senna tora]
MGLVIEWEVCQVMSEHILNGKPRLNLKRIQEAQVRTSCQTSESNRCVREESRLNLNNIQEAQVRTCCRTSESNGCVRVVFGNLSESNARMGLVTTWEVSQVMSEHILKGEPRLNLNIIQEAQVRTCCRTNESNSCLHVVFGNPCGSNARMGLVITWEVCQVMYEHIFKGKPRLNLKRIQEAQFRTCCRTKAQVRTCSRTSELNGCVRVVFGNLSGSNARMGLLITWEVSHVMSEHILKEEPRLNLNIIQEAQVRTCCRTNESNGKPTIESKSFQEAQVRTCCRTSVSNGCVRVVFGNPSGSNARMGLVITWEVCQVMSEHILNGKLLLNLNIIQEAQVRMCCRTSESNRCVRVVFGNPSGSNARMAFVVAWEKHKFEGVVAQVSQTDAFALYLGIRVDLMLQCDSRLDGRCVKSCLNTFKTENRDSILTEFKKQKFDRVVAQVSQTDAFALYLGIRVDLMLEWDS